MFIKKVFVKSRASREENPEVLLSTAPWSLAVLVEGGDNNFLTTAPSPPQPLGWQRQLIERRCNFWLRILLSQLKDLLGNTVFDTDLYYNWRVSSSVAIRRRFIDLVPELPSQRDIFKS